jgi:hypothetical protein
LRHTVRNARKCQKIHGHTNVAGVVDCAFLSNRNITQISIALDALAIMIRVSQEKQPD